jgi:hypothetical protein
MTDYAEDRRFTGYAAYNGSSFIYVNTTGPDSLNSRKPDRFLSEQTAERVIARNMPHSKNFKVVKINYYGVPYEGE